MSQSPPVQSHHATTAPIYSQQHANPQQYHQGQANVGTAPTYQSSTPFSYPPQNESSYAGNGETDFLKNSFPGGQIGLQIGSQMIHAGQDYISPYIPYRMLKIYFNVTNTYVLQKLLIILFPFRHKMWQRSVIRDAQGGVTGFQPPRQDVNSPDLYIPVMASVTYILLVGVALGLRRSFHPEKLGITASGALIFIIYMLAIIGYNFVPLIITLSMGLIFGGIGRTLTFIYTSLAMAFFMLRSLRYSFLPETSTPLVVNQRRTRVHFLFGVVAVQILCSYFLLV